jgi:hypothetical protein
MPDPSNEQPYDLEVVENNYTLTISGLGATGLQGPAGPAGATGPAGPNSVTSSTTSDGTANLSLASASVSGSLTAPTAGTGTNSTTVATTAFVQQELAAGVAVARNLEVLCRNNTGTTLTKGTIVFINDAIGNKPTITRAQANNDENSAQTIGFVKADIANNADGFVIESGLLENVNTNGLGEGTQLYLSPSEAGKWTTTKPSAPDHLVYVGIVVRDHINQGTVYVAIQNGYELNELHDVAAPSPSAGQFLKRNAGNTLWENASIVSADISDATSDGATNQGKILKSASGILPPGAHGGVYLVHVTLRGQGADVGQDLRVAYDRIQRGPAFYSWPNASGTLPSLPAYADPTAANAAVAVGDVWWDTTLNKARVRLP